MLKMDLSKIYERLLIKEIDDLGKYKTGRPAKLGNEEALKCIFQAAVHREGPSP